MSDGGAQEDGQNQEDSNLRGRELKSDNLKNGSACRSRSVSPTSQGVAEPASVARVISRPSAPTRSGSLAQLAREYRLQHRHTPNDTRAFYEPAGVYCSHPGSHTGSRSTSRAGSRSVSQTVSPALSRHHSYATIEVLEDPFAKPLNRQLAGIANKSSSRHTTKDDAAMEYMVHSHADKHLENSNLMFRTASRILIDADGSPSPEWLDSGVHTPQTSSAMTPLVHYELIQDSDSSDAESVDSVLHIGRSFQSSNTSSRQRDEGTLADENEPDWSLFSKSRLVRWTNKLLGLGLELPSLEELTSQAPTWENAVSRRRYRDRDELSDPAWVLAVAVFANRYL